jgi:hypothetical protein
LQPAANNNTSHALPRFPDENFDMGPSRLWFGSTISREAKVRQSTTRAASTRA